MSDDEEEKVTTREEWKKKALKLVKAYLNRDDEKHYSTFNGDKIPKGGECEIEEIISALLRYRFDWGWKDRDCPIDFRVVDLATHEPLPYITPLRWEEVDPEDRVEETIRNMAFVCGQLKKDMDTLKFRLSDARRKKEESLSDKIKSAILRAVKQFGSYDPAEIISYIEEELTLAELTDAVDFLKWVHTNDHHFGHNIDEVYARFVRQRKVNADV